MKTILLGNTSLRVSRLTYGCMRLHGGGAPDARRWARVALSAARDAGYTHFDHADIYGGGQSESLFGEFLRESPSWRDEIVITSKAGIVPAGEVAGTLRPKQYNATARYLAQAVEGSLRRLRTDRLDVFLLHRPDYLLDPPELAGAVETLRKEGKIRHFGLSNCRPSLVETLMHFLSEPPILHQVEINLFRLDAIVGETLDQCQRWGMTPQAWCPLGGVAYPAWGGKWDLATEQRVRRELESQAARYQCTPEAMVLAWLMRHPAGICPLVGSTRPHRITSAVKALDLDYARGDWYRLLEARQGQPVP